MGIQAIPFPSSPSTPAPSPASGVLQMADIIQAARDRTGNKADVSVGEQFVPDEAIEAGLKEAVIECNAVFGDSSARKDTVFQTVGATALTVPAAPTLTANTTSGILPAATYSYQITAARGNGETTAGPAASVTLGSQGQVVVSWTPIPGADGYFVYGRTSTGIGRLVFVPASASPTWTDSGYAMPGSQLPSSDTTGKGGPYLQDYDIATYVGTDVQEILDVIRSDNYFSDSMFQPMQVDPRTGIPFARAAWIDQSYQQNVLDVIQAQARFHKGEEESWEVVNLNGRDVLRLMPPPSEVVWVGVRYISSSESVESLPEEARTALEYAACVVLLDAVLNRVNSDPAGIGETARDRRYWLELVERQRDRYESKFRQALGKRPQS